MPRNCWRSSNNTYAQKKVLSSDPSAAAPLVFAVGGQLFEGHTEEDHELTLTHNTIRTMAALFT